MIILKTYIEYILLYKSCILWGVKMRLRNINGKRVNESSIPNVLAYGFIKNFLTDTEYELLREEYFIGNLDKNQVNQVMSDIKWLFRNYKGLNVITIEDSNKKMTRFIL